MERGKAKEILANLARRHQRRDVFLDVPDTCSGEISDTVRKHNDFVGIICHGSGYWFIIGTENSSWLCEGIIHNESNITIKTAFYDYHWKHDRESDPCSAWLDIIEVGSSNKRWFGHCELGAFIEALMGRLC